MILQRSQTEIFISRFAKFSHETIILTHIYLFSCHGISLIIVHLYSIVIEIRFCRGSNPACSKSIFTIAEIFDGGFGLQIKLVPFCKLALNDQYSTSCRNHYITPSKQTCGSNVCPNKTFSASNVLASKPVCDSNVCSRKSVSVSDVNVHPTKSVKASNICSGKPVYRSNFCQSKPTNVNILPCKPVLMDRTYHVDSSILSQ